MLSLTATYLPAADNTWPRNNLETVVVVVSLVEL